MSPMSTPDPTSARPTQLIDRGPGRALYVARSGRMYVGRGYSIWSSDDDGASWSLETKLPAPLKRRAGGLARLAARLLRYEIRALGVRADGGLVAANRDAMFVTQPGSTEPHASRIDAGEQAPCLPMTVTVGPDDEIVWGEYNAWLHDDAVRLFASRDGGAHFEVVHTFPPGEILHVHSLLFDAARDHYWLFCGDFDEEPGIGMLSRDLRHFEWLCKGEQRFRACEAFDLGDRLVYATDTPLAPNAIIALDKETGETQQLRSVQGSCLYAARFGDLCVFSTTVEPGAVDTSTSAGLWVSRDGDHFEEVVSAKKDRWPHLLQFGSLILPRGRSDRENVFFSGQAVERFDGRIHVARLSGRFAAPHRGG